jgi:NADH-quinone oxidoreductase subunit H
LIEAGRIPFDLYESEAELISGYTIEYPGFLYGLYASCEYSIILFHAISISFFFIFTPYLFSIMIFIFVIIRSTLPRFQLNQLFFFSFHYLFPNLLACFLLF